jgi:2-polyprenyl-3-methyl-5-hydroxy-6-metoxy-1,4-benzoquinol methylase
MMYQAHHAAHNYYATSWRKDERSKLYSALLTQSMQSVHKPAIADLGGRDGLFISELGLRKPDITLVDIDPVAIEQFNARVAASPHKGRGHLMDLNEDFTLTPSTFNAVVASEIIEHLNDPAHFVSEIHTILKPGGVLIGSTPNAFRLDKRLYALYGLDPKEYSDATHLQYFSLQSLRTTLAYAFSTYAVYPYRGGRFINFGSSILADGFIFICTK